MLLTYNDFRLNILAKLFGALLKFLFALFCTSSLLFVFAEVTEAPLLEEIAIIDQATFTNPILLDAPLTGTIPLLPKQYKSSLVTVGLAYLTPGLGHVYLGDLKTAGALFGTAFTTKSLAGYKKTAPFSNLMSNSNTWFYGIYAAYRDVRINNNQNGYRYQMPTDSFGDLASAPFRWNVIKKPEVWGGLIGSLAIASVVVYFSMPDREATCSLEGNIFPLSAFSIGLGEESFFRGYLQSFLAERLSPTAAITLSSLAFGAVHIPNALYLHKEQRMNYYTFSLPLITSLGGYMGWLTHKNRSLKSSVALHAWYDFTLFTISTLAAPTASMGKPTFKHTFNF